MAKDFTTLSDTEHYENLMLVDSLNLAFRYKHNGTKNYAAKYLETVRSLARSYECNEVIILADFKGSSWRKSIYPEYKGNRKILQDKQTEEEREEFEEFFSDYLKTLDLLEKSGFTVLKYEGVEADDLAAYIVKYYSENYNHTWMISTDKDWDLLIKEDTSKFSYITRKEYSLNNWDEHHDVNLEEFISFKVLVGDTGDNVIGVEGIGPKRASALIKEFGSALDIMDYLPIDRKAKFIQNLNAFGDKILLNYQLMDLLTFCEEAIGLDNIEDLRRKMS